MTKSAYINLPHAIPSGQKARGKIVSGDVSVSLSAERNAGLTWARNEHVSQPAVLVRKLQHAALGIVKGTDLEAAHSVA